MSLEMTGRVVKISKDTIKNGKNVGKTYYKVVMEDNEGGPQLFNAWSFEAIKDLQIGKDATVDYNVSPDGKFRHINQSVLVTDINSQEDDFPYGANQKAIETPSPAATRVYESKSDNKGLGNVHINRMSALKTAVEYYSGQQPDIETLIGTAERFLEFIETGV